jgi:hypothetical protein
MGCQYKIANQIVNAGADYVLSLKENQETLYEDGKTYFEGIAVMVCPPVKGRMARVSFATAPAVKAKKSRIPRKRPMRWGMER